MSLGGAHLFIGPISKKGTTPKASIAGTPRAPGGHLQCRPALALFHCRNYGSGHARGAGCPAVKAVRLRS